MNRRWTAAALAVLAATALACERGAASTGTGAGATGKPTRTDLPASMAALGDSISAGYGSCLTLVACHRNSWSTGTGARVDSHYRRILKDNPAIRNRVHTLAVPGATAAGLAAQARAAVDARAGYVTVLIGANDACRGTVAAMTAPATFRRQVDAALAVLRTGLPRTPVLVVAVPDLHRLWEVGHTDARAVRAWNLGVCPALLANPTSQAAPDVARRAAVRQRVDAYNGQLRAACRASGRHCRYEPAAHRVRFTLAHVSRLDYFHPNAAGQDRLAEVTWPRRFGW